MEINRRHLFCNGSALFACSCLPIAAFAESHSVGEAEVPAEEFGCSTLDTFSDEMEIINFSSDQREIIQNLQITDYGTFVFAKRWRRNDGLTKNTGIITLGCHFINGTQAQQDRVIESARDWLKGELGELIDFRFGVTSEKSHIRILLGGNRNNSYVGRDSLKINKSKPTMRLANFNRRATVKHEFGHALGLRHEHRFPGAIEFNEDVVVEKMRRSHDWTTAQTYRNILTPLGESAKCIGDPNLNEDSIMMYTIPSNWTADGQSYRRAGVITERDRKCLIGVYSA